mmetsp:Transcript_18215/g.50756  ORF Transcript_18215/g.50756 Transcript_18215/m.50756 type:complete len:200 (+) Transcript_18215:367-966(+)
MRSDLSHSFIPLWSPRWCPTWRGLCFARLPNQRPSPRHTVPSCRAPSNVLGRRHEGFESRRTSSRENVDDDDDVCDCDSCRCCRRRHDPGTFPRPGRTRCERERDRSRTRFRSSAWRSRGPVVFGAPTRERSGTRHRHVSCGPAGARPGGRPRIRSTKRRLRPTSTAPPTENEPASGPGRRGRWLLLLLLPQFLPCRRC